MFKDLFYAGIGLVTLTREKAEELVSELVKKGELSAEEGKVAMNNLASRMQDEKEKFRQKIDEQVETVISSMNLVKKPELDEIKEKLNQIEEKVDMLINKEEV